MLRFLDRHFEEVIAGFGLLVMSTMVFAQVVMRYAFSAPMSWSDEIAVYCMVWSVYLSASWAVRERAHIRVLNLIELFPKPISTWLIYISDFIWLIFSVFICWQGRPPAYVFVGEKLSVTRSRYRSEMALRGRRCWIWFDVISVDPDLCPSFQVR